ncbi:HAMP domain-containing histidine kinase [Tyzzerella sp. OttesenSCG-928-J15]|nr:HAMP domain-containing histidine kinase [Tyzzerella sp. OttesenSCG-928-J15]MDL2248238.1 HAMP domain-containing histidine kinase [Tyzzerella sp. OttesenSCG-928-J15]
MQTDDKSTAIEEIAAVIAHEVKNPLTMVTANIDILEATDDRHLDKNYALIRKELKKINDIMLDFIHLTQMRTAENDIVYITDILNEICFDTKISAPEVEIEFKYKDNDICIYASEESIKILFANIMKNALEAMDYKGLIKIAVTQVKNKVKITFADSGKGIDNEISGKIFDKYFTTKPSGSGLGLSICKKIAEDHGGSFSLENAENGCIATVILPCIVD